LVESEHSSEKKPVITKKNAQSQTNIEYTCRNQQEHQETTVNREIQEKIELLDTEDLAKEENNKGVDFSKKEIYTNISSKNELAVENQGNDPLILKTNAQEKQIYKLNKELEISKETIETLKRNENQLKER